MRGVVVVTLLCVLAGCSAAPGSDGTATPVTSAEVPADRPADYPFAPGVHENGSVDPDALARAHRAAVTNRSHTVVYRVNVSTAVDGEVVSTSNWTRTVAYGNATVYRSDVTYDAVGYRNASGGTSVYANGTVEVHFINVGQSVSTLVVGPTGETMLVDTGHFNDDGEYVLVNTVECPVHIRALSSDLPRDITRMHGHQEVTKVT